MTRWDPPTARLVEAALRVAIQPPLQPKEHTWAAKVPWTDMTRLREALQDAGLDWQEVKKRAQG